MNALMNNDAVPSDVVCVGGGLVGCALAIALARGGFGTTLIEPHATAQPAAFDTWDARVYALSPGSRAWLETLGAWRHVPAERIGIIDAMQVFGDDTRSRLGFDSAGGGLAALAYTVEHRVLQAALWQAVHEAAADGAALRVSTAVPLALQIDDARAELTLRDAASVRASLVIGSDGLHSWTRTAAGLSARERPYGQQALIADFATVENHRNIAYQWFRTDGVLALLPMPGNRVSVVWSLQDDEAARLLALSADAFADAVRTAAGDALGALKPITPVQSVPLQALRVPQIVASRVALVGDAAHGVHPLAGQGVNLGFRDAQALTATLAAREPGRDLGDFMLLRRYARARSEDVWMTQLVTDGLARLFTARGKFIGRLRNAGLAATDRFTPLKRFFTERAAA